MLKLLSATEVSLDKIKAGLTEIKDNPTPYDIYQVRKAIEFMEKGFVGYLDDQKARGQEKQPEGQVPSTVLFLFEDDTFIGLYDVRHRLNEKLKKSGGHIAYEIVPSFRQKGYVKAGLKLVLDWCFEHLKLEQVLVCCHAENIASYRTMKSVMFEQGGFEQAPVQIENHFENRVWIKTQSKWKNRIRPLAVGVIRKGSRVLAIPGYDSKKDKHFYRLPGGGIEFGETAEEALKREFQEELALDIEILFQYKTIQSIFEFNGKKGHEIIFPFECKLSPENMKKEKFSLIEDCFDGQFAQFIELGDVPVYPEGILKTF